MYIVRHDKVLNVCCNFKARKHLGLWLYVVRVNVVRVKDRVLPPTFNVSSVSRAAHPSPLDIIFQRSGGVENFSRVLYNL